MDPTTRPLNPSDPDRLGRFNVLARLGAGGMGVAYLAQTEAGDPAVIKAVQLDLADNHEIRRRFRQEVLATAAVESPFVPQVLASDLSATRQWVAIEYIAGPTLAELIKRDGPLAKGQQYALAAALADGLAQIHANALIHRDVKPGNIICTERGPRLIDFGIATRANLRGITATGALAPGSPGWMAPEQLDPVASPTPAIDVFAWGCVCWYAATARSPFAASNADESLRMLRSWRSGQTAAPERMHPDLAPLAVQALAVRPTERPSSAALSAVFGDATGGVTSDLVATAWSPTATTTELVTPTLAGTRLAPERPSGTRDELSPNEGRRRDIRRPAAAVAVVAAILGIGFAAGTLVVDDPAESSGASTSATPSTSTPTDSGGVGEDSPHSDASTSPGNPSSDSVRSSSPKPRPTATHQPRASNSPPPGYGGKHPVGYGPVKLGMTRDELLATGEVTYYEGSPEASCVRYGLRAGGYAGYSIALKRVVYIEFTGKMATSRGIRIGSTADQVFAAYPHAPADRMQFVYPQIAPGVSYVIGIYDGLVELLILESERQDCAM